MRAVKATSTAINRKLDVILRNVRAYRSAEGIGVFRCYIESYKVIGSIILAGVYNNGIPSIRNYD